MTEIFPDLSESPRAVQIQAIWREPVSIESEIPHIERRRLEISAAEFTLRRERVREMLADRDFDAIILFNPVRTEYLTGFTHISTERPMALVLPQEGEPAMLIPDLEREHLKEAETVHHVKTYPEYPAGESGKHPMQHLAGLLRDMGLKDKKLAADRDGYQDINGYLGPSMSHVLDNKVGELPEIVDELRQVKSEAELELIRHSCIWGNLAHRLLQDCMEVGRTEIDISLAATRDANRYMLKTLGRSYPSHGRGIRNMPVHASFIAGSNTSLPHGLRRETGLRPGDAIITGACANVGGYRSEIERTMIVGQPSPEFRRHYEMMLQIQDTAFAAFRPGRRCAEIEADVVKAFADLGVKEMMRHHTGHGIGLEGHEQPFCDLGDDTVVKPGMVFSVEPGLYVPAMAGFRASDTILITESGCEIATYYPRELDSLIVPA